MHELAVCQALVDQVEKIAREREAVRVVSILVRIGPLSGVEAKLLEHAYPLASAGSLAADAELVLETLPVRVRCLACRVESEVVPNRLVCASCGNWETRVVSGEELILASVELETLEPQDSDDGETVIH